jgi:hypothetical protein
MKRVVPRDDFDREFLARLDKWRRELIAGLPVRGVAALALVPVWTERLLACVDLQLGAWPLDRFLDEAERRGLCTRSAVQDDATASLRRARALMLLWPSLKDAPRRAWGTRVLDLVREMPRSLEQLQFLVTLSSTHPEVADEVSLALMTWPDREMRARLFARLAMATNDKKIAARALSTLIALPGGLPDREEYLSLCTSMWAAVALPDTTIIDEFAYEARQLDDLEARARALLRLTPLAKDDDQRKRLKGEALLEVMKIADPEEQAFALSGIAGAFDENDRAVVVTQMLAAVRQIASPIARAHVLAQVAPSAGQDPALRDALRGTLLELRNTTEPSPERDGALAALAVPLVAAGEDARDVAVSMSDIRESWARLEAFAAIADAEAAPSRAIGRGNWPLLLRTGRWDLLPPFARHLAADSEWLHNLPVTLAQAIPDAQTRQTVMLALAARLSERDRRPIVATLTQSLRTMTDERGLLRALAQIAPHLPEDLLEETCQFIWTQRDDRGCAMPDALRHDVILPLRQVFAPTGAGSLSSFLCTLGDTLVKASESGAAGLTPATARWAQIASRCALPRVASKFLADIFERLVNADDTGEATEWYTTAERIVPIVGAELEPAVALGRRRVEVACRRLMDTRLLKRHLAREDQSKAFETLIGGTPNHNPNHWALHFIGMGGVGKTMLLRHVMANLAIVNGQRLPVARVDFDHMKPEYPVKQPGVLLVQLADELRLFLPPGADDRYASFQGSVLELHGALSREPAPGNPLQNIRTPEFDRLLNGFAAMLSELPKPVILILDTCEELAKLEPEGESIPAVEATFEILERLHDREPGIRVVFAGRRLLARAGAGWLAPEFTLSRRNAILPAAKKYLLLHMIRGFEEADADRYFTQIAKVRVNSEQRPAILTRSLDNSVPADIMRDDGEIVVAAATPASPRYNPFDISLYADWVQADPDVRAEVIGSGEMDPYVDMRILRRIEDADLRRVVPGAVVLRQFDQEMLRPLLPEDNERAARVFRDLGGQEWIDYRDAFLRVQTNLLQRLQAYYDKPANRGLIESAAQKLAPGLDARIRRALTADDPLGALSTPLLDAALRLLPPEAAALLWDAFDRRICETANWSTAESICEFLLEQHNAAGRKESPVAAAVRATLSACRLHNWPSYDATSDWKQIDVAADYHPDSALRGWLKMRARLALGEWNQGLISVARIYLEHLDDWHTEQLGASAIAAIETSRGRGHDVPLPGTMNTMFGRAFSDELETYWSGLRRDRSSSRATAIPWLTDRRWADWRSPESITARVALLDVDVESSPYELVQNLGAVAPKIDNIDAEALASRQIELLLAHRPAPQPLLETILRQQVYDHNRVPWTRAHFEAKPLFAVVGEALVANGFADRALRLAREVRDLAKEHQDTRAADEAKLLQQQITRRFRLPGSGAAVKELVQRQHPDSVAAHYQWILRGANSPAVTREVLREFDEELAEPLKKAAPEDDHAAIDFIEANILGRRINRTPRRAPLDKPPPASAPPAVIARWGALHDDLITLGSMGKPRERAEVLLEEAELLMLRLPDAAISLLTQAEASFAQVDDHCGALIASLSACIGAFKARRKPDAVLWFGRAATHYDRLRTSQQPYLGTLGLPSWEALTSLSNGTDEIPGAFTWHPWLLRILRIQAFLDEGADGGPKTTAVNQRIAQYMGAESHPEFSLTPFEDAPLLTFRGWAAGVLGTMAETLAGLGGIFVGGYLLWLFGKWAWSSPTALAIIGVAIYVAFISWLLQWTFGSLMRSAAVRNNLRIDITGQAPRMELTFFFWLSMPFFIRPRTVRMLHILRDAPFRPYADSAIDPEWFGRPLLTKLRALLIPWGHFVVPIFADAAGGYCWEAMLALDPESKRRRHTREPVVFLRAAPRLPKDPSGVQAWSEARVDLRAGVNLITTFGLCWWDGKRGAPKEQDDLRVLHLIGRVRRGAHGVLFTHFSGAQPVRVSDLPLSRAAIVIVQEEPVGRLQRLDVDREQTADTREFAGELFAAGAHTVVLIPAMPLELAMSAIRVMSAEWDRSDAPTLWRLVSGVSAARRRIYRYKPASDEWDRTQAGDPASAINELAMEVTLFARHQGFRTTRDSAASERTNRA